MFFKKSPQLQAEIAKALEEDAHYQTLNTEINIVLNFGNSKAEQQLAHEMDIQVDKRRRQLERAVKKKLSSSDFRKQVNKVRQKDEAYKDLSALFHFSLAATLSKATLEAGTQAVKASQDRTQRFNEIEQEVFKNMGEVLLSRPTMSL